MFRLCPVLVAAILALGCSESGPGSQHEHDPDPKPEPGRSVQSSFDSGAEGWIVIENGGDEPPPVFHPEGGNPGGYISADDSAWVIVYRFVAPAKFLGNNIDMYGGTLRYDLKVSPTDSPFEDSDVVITGGGLTIWYDTSPAPSDTWQTFSIPLTETGWKKGTFDEPAGDVTREEFQQALTNMMELTIRGEYINWDDTCSLDNVILAERP